MSTPDREPADLRTRWTHSLGCDPATLSGSAGATLKPPAATLSDLPTVAPAVVSATLSDLPTVAPAVASATLSDLPTIGAIAASTLSGAATAVAAAEAGTPAGTAPDIRQRLHAAGYDLRDVVGEGGMGVVHRAHQRSLRRDVAIKLIRPALDRPQVRVGFVGEAQVNGLLDHPNIVPVHELGNDSDGSVFLAMKLVDGIAWKDLLHPRNDAHRLAAAGYDLDRHLAILDSVANAVGFAHSRGIVHRDLKPANVMVGAFGEVLVMDWGIAVDIHDRPDADRRTASHRASRAPAGTPNYMAPELAEGRGEDIGPWTDTYLLGGILHELLTGEPPHRGANLLAVLHAASSAVPPDLAPAIPAGLAAICRRALSREPADRYPTASALQVALADFRTHRTSERVADLARAALDRARAAKGTAAVRYGEFAEAVAGFRQAVALWTGNARAADGERLARLAYAEAALADGDLGLAEAQALALPERDAERARVLATVAAEHATRQRQVTAARRTRRLLASAVLTIVVGLASGLALINAGRQATERERQRAEGQRALAQDSERLARSRLAEAWTENGRRALFAGDPESALLWLDQAMGEGVDDAPTRLLIARALDRLAGKVASLDGHTAAIARLAFSTGGDHLISEGRDGTTRRWAWRDGSVTVLRRGGLDSSPYPPPESGERPDSVDAGAALGLDFISEDHPTLLAADGTRRDLTVRTRAGRLSLDGRHLIFSGGGTTLATLPTDGSNSVPVPLPDSVWSDIERIAWCAGGRLALVPAANNQGHRLCALATGEVLLRLAADGHALVADDGGTLLWIAKHGAARCWDLRSGRPLEGPPLPTTVSAVAGCTGRAIALHTATNAITIVDLDAPQMPWIIGRAGRDGAELRALRLALDWLMVKDASGRLTWHGRGTAGAAGIWESSSGPWILHPTRALAAVGAQDGTATVLDLAGGGPLAQVGHHDRPIERLAFHGTLPVLALADNDGDLSVWEVVATRPVPAWKATAEAAPDPGSFGDDPVQRPEGFSPDRRFFLVCERQPAPATGQASSLAKLGIAEVGTPVVRWLPQSVDLASVTWTWSSDSARLAVAEPHQRRITIWRTAETTAVGVLADEMLLAGTSRGVYAGALAFLANGHLAAATVHGDVVIYDPAAGRRVATLGPAGEGATVLAAAGGRVLLIDTQQRASLWDGDRQVPIALAGMPASHWGALAPDGSLAVLADSRHRLWVFSADGRRLHLLTGHAAAITAAVFTPDTGLVTGDDTGQVIAWDLTAGSARWAIRIDAAADDRTGTTSGNIDNGTRGVCGLACTADGALLAVASMRTGQEVSVWDARHGRLLATHAATLGSSLSGRPQGVGLRFTAAGQLILTTAGAAITLSVQPWSGTRESLATTVARISAWHWRDGRLLPRFAPAAGDAELPGDLGVKEAPGAISLDQARQRQLTAAAGDPERIHDLVLGCIQRWLDNPHDPMTASECLRLLATVAEGHPDDATLDGTLDALERLLGLPTVPATALGDRLRLLLHCGRRRLADETSADRVAAARRLADAVLALAGDRRRDALDARLLRVDAALAETPGKFSAEHTRAILVEAQAAAALTTGLETTAAAAATRAHLISAAAHFRLRQVQEALVACSAAQPFLSGIDVERDPLRVAVATLHLRCADSLALPAERAAALTSLRAIRDRGGEAGEEAGNVLHQHQPATSPP